MHGIVFLHGAPSLRERTREHRTEIKRIDGAQIGEDGLDGHIIVWHDERAVIGHYDASMNHIPSLQGIAFLGRDRQRHDMSFLCGIHISHHITMFGLTDCDAKSFGLHVSRRIYHLVDIHVEAIGIVDDQFVFSFLQ